MGHIGAGGVDAHFRNQAGGRNPNRQKRFTRQDPELNVSPMLNRSDSFSSFTGKHANFSSSKAVANRHGDDQIVCKREAFYVVEVCSKADMLGMDIKRLASSSLFYQIYKSSCQQGSFACVPAL